MSSTRESSDAQLVVYADYVCPFCYLGRKSLDQYLASRESSDGGESDRERDREHSHESDTDLTIDWHPFDLRRGKRNPDGSIDHSVDDGKDDDYFEQARQNVRRLQERYDVEMAQELATDVDSLNAQLASLYIADTAPDQWRDFDEAVYDALWQDGRDIGDEDVLVDLAESVGLSATEIRTALTDDGHREQLEAAFVDAQNQGITGVPTFVFDGHAARGAVPPAHLRRLVDGS